MAQQEIEKAILQFFEYYPGVTTPQTIFQVMRADGVGWTVEQMTGQIASMVAESKLYQREDGAVTNDIAHLVA